MADLLTKITQHAAWRPDADALVDASGNRVSWAQLDENTSRLAAGFGRRGHRPGDRVAIGIFRGTIALQLFLSIQRAGLVPVVCGPGAGAGFADMVTDLGIVEAFVGPELKDSVPAGLMCWSVDDVDVLTAAAADPTGEPWRARPESDVAAIQFSTGSTGVPKGMIRTVGNDHADAVNRCLAMGVRSGDRWLCAAPSNINVAIGALRCTLLMGGTIVALDEVTPDAIELQTRGGIDVLPLQAHDWRAAFDAGVAQQLPFRGLRIAVATGGRADAATIRLLDDLMAHVGSALNIYGLTEAGSVAISTTASRSVAGPFSVGVPTPLTEVSIDNSAQTTVGEILIRGAAVSRGSAQTPDTDTDTDTDTADETWFRTGDLGEIDSRGELNVYGRLADRLIINGATVMPALVEASLCEIDGIAEAVLISNTATAAVRAVIHTDSDVDVNEVVKVLADLGPHVSVVAVDRLPRNFGGKTDRRAVATLGDDEVRYLWAADARVVNPDG